MHIFKSKALLATAIALVASPVVAASSSPKPVNGQIAAADLSDDQVLDCISRMITLSNAARKISRDKSTSADDRVTFDNLDDQSSMAVTFYAGLLYSRPWIADRRDQMARVDKNIAAEDSDTSSKKAFACLERSRQSVIDTFGPLTSK